MLLPFWFGFSLVGCVMSRVSFGLSFARGVVLSPILVISGVKGNFNDTLIIWITNYFDIDETELIMELSPDFTINTRSL